MSEHSPGASGDGGRGGALADALEEVGVPVDLYTVVARGGGRGGVIEDF